MAGPKPMRTEFGIHLRLESCVAYCTHILASDVSYVWTDDFANHFCIFPNAEMYLIRPKENTHPPFF